MFGEKDLIFLGAIMLAAHWAADPDSAVAGAVRIYETVFGRVSDDELRNNYSNKE